MKARPEVFATGPVPPSPPEALRRRVLTRAHSALGERPVPDVWDRLWTNRPLRLAWAAAVAALVLAQLAVGPRRPGGADAPGLPVMAAAVGELAPIAEIGRLTAELPGWEIAAETNRQPREERNSS